MAYKPGQYSKALAATKYHEKRLEIQDSKNKGRNERHCGSQLHNEGRKALFRVMIEQKRFEEQELPQISEFENIIETYHFNEGVKRGVFLFENEIIPEEFKEKYEQLVELGIKDTNYTNGINYLIQRGILPEDYLQTSKKHR